MINPTFFIRLFKATIATLLVPDLHDVTALIIKDNNRHREEEVLHIEHLFDEEAVELVAEAEISNIPILCFLLRIDIEEADPLSVTCECIEEFILRHDHVFANLIDDVIRKHVIATERDILIRLAALRKGARLNNTTIIKHHRRIFGIFGICRRAVTIHEASSRCAVDLDIATLFNKL